jgi:hypothetical protein
MKPRHWLIGLSGLTLAALGAVCLWTPSAPAQQPAERALRIEGTLACVSYDGNDSTIAIRTDEGAVREIRLRQFHVDQWATLIALLNNGNRVVYEVARDGSANVFPTAVYPRKDK